MPLSFISMANNGWNSRHPHPHNTAQIACRLCSQVFTDREVLIAHIDSHLAHEEIALKSLHQPHRNTSQTETFGNHQFIPNFPRAPPSVQEINRNVSRDTRAFWASSPLSMVAPPPPMVVPPPRRNPNSFNAIGRASASPQPPLLGFSSTMNNNKNVTTQQFQQRNLEEMYTSEGTKPFIKMLERPIKKIEFIDLDIDDGESDSLILDLTLKL